MAPRLFRQADAIAKPGGCAHLLTRARAHQILGLGPDSAIIAKLKLPLAVLRIAAVIVEMLAHHAAIALPTGLEIAGEPRRDPPQGAVNHPFAFDRAVQMLAQVKLGTLLRVIFRCLRVKARIALFQQHQRQHRERPQQGPSQSLHQISSFPQLVFGPRA